MLVLRAVAARNELDGLEQPAGRLALPDLAEPAAPAHVAPEQTVLHGDGFMPGEDVAVAVVVARCDAGPDGIAQGLLTLDQLGRLSGAHTVGQPA